MMTTSATTARLFHPTTQKQDVLRNVARHELTTINQLVYLIYGTTENPKELSVWQASTRRTVRILRNHDYLHTTFFRPSDFKGQGKYPSVAWLSKKGEDFAREHFPATDPKSHGSQRSDLNLLHDINRTDTRIALYEMAERHGLQIACKKTDLQHFIKPDDLFELTKEKTLHFFLEQERVKKEYQELYDKFEPYVRYQGSGEFKKLWGFRNYTVIIPMRDAEARDSAVTHFAGRCNCIDPKLRRPHSSAPFKLDSDILWFTTHQDITKNTAAPIFLSPTDKKHSFLELIQ